MELAYLLYQKNLFLSQKMYAVIGMFEVVFRNTIDRHFLASKGGLWLENAVAPGGYLEITPGCEDSFRCVQEAIHKLGLRYTHDRLIAKLTLGFWTYQFSKKEFAASGSTLLEIFPKRPFGISQKVVFQHLIRINDTRNRIAHYEPICFDHENISTERTVKRYQLIKEMLDWLGCNSQNILSGINNIKDTVEEIEQIVQACRFV
jgi:hypothetical protein